MIRSELVQKLAAQSPLLYQRDLERIVNIVLDEILGALKEGDRIQLRGFGTFSAKARTARIGRNPRTGSAVKVTAKKAPAFKPGKDMRERLNAPVSSPASHTTDQEQVDWVGGPTVVEANRR